MLTLNTRVALNKKRKRVGRGGKLGGTSGRGMKGQKSRSGAGRKISATFEGGQMPLQRRMPKVGFNNTRFRKEYELIKCSLLDLHFDGSTVITKELLKEKGLIRSSVTYIKLLGNGDISKKLKVVVDACSASAREKIMSHGGEVAIV